MSYQVELNFLVYTSSRHSVSTDFAVTQKYRAGLLKPFSLAVELLMKKTFYLFTYAEIDPHESSQNNVHV